MEEKIKNYLEQFEFIEFALIFGSNASGRTGYLSDLDIGIYSNSDINLLLLGKIISELEKISNKNVDLVELNGLYKKSPVFAYKIVSNHKLLFSKNDENYIKFKRNSLLYYFDTEKLREAVNSALRKRIKSNKFGKRNYA